MTPLERLRGWESLGVKILTVSGVLEGMTKTNYVHYWDKVLQTQDPFKVVVDFGLGKMTRQEIDKWLSFVESEARRLNTPDMKPSEALCEEWHGLVLDVLVHSSTHPSLPPLSPPQSRTFYEDMTKVEVTEYSRPEAFNPVSRVRACRTTDQHHWKVYCTSGPNWVWNSRTEEWVIVAFINSGDPDDDFLMTKEEALRVLETVPSKDEQEHG